MIDARIMVERVNEFINNSYTNPDLSTKMISEKFRISQSYLCHIYKGCTNTSINSTITMLRIKHAQKLLKESNYSIIQISKKVGYLDSHYFAKVYKKITGIAPTEARNLLSNK
jgi:two-component system response regulator YesN